MRKLTCLFLLALALSGTADAASLADGVTALSQARYKDALQILLPLANGGDSEAQRRIGEMAYSGFGMKKNFLAAFKWNELAAANGDRIAMYNLGYLYERGEGTARDQQKSLDWYQRSAENGYPQAQYKLGTLYEQTNRDLAIAWYEKAFKQGHALAGQRFNALGTVQRQEQDAREAEYEARTAEAERKVKAKAAQERLKQEAEESRAREARQERAAQERLQDRNDGRDLNNELATIRSVGNGISAAAARTSAQTRAAIANAQAAQCQQTCESSISACRQAGAQRACYQASACVKRCTANASPGSPDAAALLQSAAEDERSAASLANSPYTFNFGHTTPTPPAAPNPSQYPSSTEYHCPANVPPPCASGAR